jgi:plastocyanin
VNAGGPRPTLGYLDVTFTKAGTFGYRCKTHPVDMFGAVQVVP